MGDSVTANRERAAALTALARLLYETLERLDPGLEAAPWDALELGDQAIYEHCIREISKRRGMLALLAND